MHKGLGKELGIETPLHIEKLVRLLIKCKKLYTKKESHFLIEKE